MKISLREARRIEREVGAQIDIDSSSARSLGGAISVSIYEDMTQKIAEAQKNTIAEVARASSLISLRFKIRKSIETTNETAGINSLMNVEAKLKANAKVLSTALSISEMDDATFDITWQRHEALKNEHKAGTPPRNHYGAATDASTVHNTMRTETLATLRADAKIIQRELLKVVNELSRLNASTMIELSEDDVKALEAADIVVA